MPTRKRTLKPNAQQTEDDLARKYFHHELAVSRVSALSKVLIGLIIVVATFFFTKFYIYAKVEVITMVSASNNYSRFYYEVPCSKDYQEERKLFKDCVPKRCGRVVMDSVVTKQEARKLLRIVRNAMVLGGSNGGASILDLHTGAISKGNAFINIFKALESHPEPDQILTAEDFMIYKKVKDKIHSAVAAEFEVPKDKLYLTKPTFFSRLTTKPAKTIHDEYWHPHIDKETYGSFHYTSLLYLTEYMEDFRGGRFFFIDKDTNRTVEPVTGRLSFFTSGSENLHFVERLKEGARYAITVSFTCDPEKAIGDPRLK
ncbi:unnamed protein product [Owenia fusiformis]|uniref:Uncharacterized protein n=1 Tax=Owenia fusiformis TaxID=6347 RepID=A0A8J1U972_OWEFU|nr:unnamed protein product [Owenia fusiformis]